MYDVIFKNTIPDFGQKCYHSALQTLFLSTIFLFSIVVQSFLSLDVKVRVEAFIPATPLPLSQTPKFSFSLQKNSLLYIMSLGNYQTNSVDNYQNDPPLTTEIYCIPYFTYVL